jgi:hypothetical protein
MTCLRKWQSSTPKCAEKCRFVGFSDFGFFHFDAGGGGGVRIVRTKFLFTDPPGKL